jgi:methionine synthase II (cobalamin-independent)
MPAVFTDGELRRRNFMSDFTDAVEGFDLGDAVARTPFVTKVTGNAVVRRAKIASVR